MNLRTRTRPGPGSDPGAKTGKKKGITMTRIAVILLALAVLASGCGGSNESDYLTLADTCDPRMEAALESWADAGLSGSITVLGGDRQCSIGIGLADPDTGRAVTADTAFSIGSITKAVTAAAILDLVDAGVLSLDDTTGDHLVGLTGGAEDLVIKDLLLHSSGLTGYHGNDHKPMTETEAIEAISALEITGGGRFNYTNSGYTLLGLIIENVTEEGYRRYVLDNIVRDGNGDPIGGFWDGEPAAQPRAMGWRSDGLRGETGDFAGPHWSLEANGGIAMTTLEMAEWARALWSGEILSPEATELLTTVRNQSEFGVAELPGWAELRDEAIGEQAFATSGGGGAIGHNMETFWLPDTERAIVIATNSTSAITRGFTGDMLLPLFNGTGIPTPTPVPEVDAANTERLVGDYRLDGGDELFRIKRWEAGFLIESSGSETLRVLFPNPPGFDAEIERHEQHALDYANGVTSEGRSERARLEAERGPIAEVELIGTICCVLETFLWLHYEDGTSEVLLLELNERGGSEGIGEGHASRFVVLRDDGTFGGYRPNPSDVFQVIPTGEPGSYGIEIVGPDGTTTATKIG